MWRTGEIPVKKLKYFQRWSMSRKKKIKINRPKSRVEGICSPRKILNQRQRNEENQKIYGAGCRNLFPFFKVRLWE